MGLLIAGGDVLLTDDGFDSTTLVSFDDPLLAAAQITSLSVDADDGSLVLGTDSRGAWRVPGFLPHQGLGGGSAGSGGVVPRHYAVGLPDLGTSWGLGVDRAVGGTSGLLLASVTQGALPIFGGTFVVGFPILVELPVVTDGVPGEAGAGAFELLVALPSDPLLVGLIMVSQVGLLDAGTPGPGNKALSNGLRTTFR